MLTKTKNKYHSRKSHTVRLESPEDTGDQKVTPLP